MKNHFLFPYWCRFLGWGLFLFHIPVVIFRDNLGFRFNEDSPAQGVFNSHHVFFILTALLMTVGLFLVAFAKEKIEAGHYSFSVDEKIADSGKVRD